MSNSTENDPELKSIVSTIQACVGSTQDNLTVEQLHSKYFELSLFLIFIIHATSVSTL